MGTCTGTTFPGSGTMGIAVEGPAEFSGTLIPDTFLMALATPITTKATATVTGTAFNDSTKEPYVIELNVTTINSGTEQGNTPAQICKKTVRANNVKAGATVTLTASNECRWTQLGLGYNGESGPVGFQKTRVDMYLYGKDGSFQNQYTGDISTTYAFLPRIDELRLFEHTPASGPLVPHASVPFTARVRVLLRTRRDADLALRLYDADGNLVGTSDFVRVNRSYEEKDYNLSIPAVTIPGSDKLELRAVLIDRTTGRVFKESKDTYTVAARCALEGELRAEFLWDSYWLPDVPVELIDHATGAVVATTQSGPDPLNARVKSFYCFNTALVSGKQYRARVKLFDAAQLSNSRIAFFDSTSATNPSEAQWKPFSVTATTRNKHDLVVGNREDLDVPDALTTVGAAITYANLWRLVHDFWPKMFPGRAMRGDLPVEVYMNGTTVSHYCATTANDPAQCPKNSSLVLQRVDSLPGSHRHVIGHEFGHHVVRELYGIGRIVAPNFLDNDLFKHAKPHAGYANSWSSDSLDEGFASLWAVLADRVLDGSTSASMTVNYLETPTQLNPAQASIDFEENWAAWFPRHPDDGTTGLLIPREELAAAGILWDLIDEAPEIERAGDVAWASATGTIYPSDSISLPAKDVMAIIASDIPITLKDLHDILIRKLPAALTTTVGNPRASGLSQLDEIFVMHRVFHDNGDWKFQLGEEVGAPAHDGKWNGHLEDGRRIAIPGRPWRQNLPLMPKSTIRLDFRDRAGNPVSSAGIKVDLQFGPGFENFNSSRVLPVQSGKVYFEMPPDHYPVRAVISVPGASSDPLIIENSTYWSLVGIAETIAEKTLTVPSPAIASLQPSSGGTLSTVIINGSDFSAVPAENLVNFGAVRAEVTAAAPARLTVAVPSGLSLGPIAVKVFVGGRPTGDSSFNVTLRGINIPDASLNFGLVQAETSVERTFTIRNGGTAPVVVRSLGLAPGFSLVSPAAPFTVPAGGQTVVTVRFRPGGEGDASAELLVNSDDPANPVLGVYATAFGLAKSSAEIDIRPRGINFGAVTPGQTRTSAIVVKNNGSAPLLVSGATSSIGQFTIAAPALPFTIAPGGEQSVDVRFAPSAAGVFNGTITLTTNDASDPSVRLQLRGDGAAGSDDLVAIDDGTSERGVVANGLIVVNRLTPPRYPATLKKIRVFFQQFAGGTNPSGAPITLIAFADPQAVGAPPGGPFRLVSQSVTIPSVPAAGAFVEFSITDGPTILSGDLYVGYQAPNPAGGVAYAGDSNGTQRQRGWFSTDNGLSFRGPLISVVDGMEIPLNIMIRGVFATGSTATDCQLTLNPAEFSFNGAGGIGAVTVTSAPSCAWAASTTTPWLFVSSNRSANGNAVVGFVADKNNGGEARSGSLTVGGVTIAVSESAAASRRRAVRH